MSDSVVSRYFHYIFYPFRIMIKPVNFLGPLAILKESNAVVLDVSALLPRLYFLEVHDNEGRRLGNIRFSKL